MLADHVDRAFGSDEAVRPRQVEPPLHIGAAGRPQAEVSVLTDDEECDVFVGDVRKRRESLPTAPARRLRVTGTDDVADLRMQAVSTDHQIPRCGSPVLDLDPHPAAAASPFHRYA